MLAAPVYAFRVVYSLPYAFALVRFSYTVRVLMDQRVLLLSVRALVFYDRAYTFSLDILA